MFKKNAIDHVLASWTQAITIDCVNPIPKTTEAIYTTGYMEFHSLSENQPQPAYCDPYSVQYNGQNIFILPKTAIFNPTTGADYLLIDGLEGAVLRRHLTANTESLDATSLASGNYIRVLLSSSGKKGSFTVPKKVGLPFKL